MTYWVTFADGYAGCVETAHGMTVGSEMAIQGVKNMFQYSQHIKDHGEIVSIDCLPYPATPRIVTVSWDDHGACPAFCFKPKQCKGHTSCPQNYSCTE